MNKLFLALCILLSLLFTTTQAQETQNTDTAQTNAQTQAEVAVEQAMPLVNMDNVSNYMNIPRRNMALVSIEDDITLGVNHAPLVLIEFSDVNCPYCGRFHAETLPSLIQQYVDTERMRFVYRDLVTVGGDYSFYSAYAAECVRDQMETDREYIDFMIQFYNVRGIKSVDKLKELSLSTNVDQTILTSCIDQDWFYDEVNQDVDDARRLGFRSTPIFILGYQGADGFVEGFALRGALPYQTFAEQIERMLAAVQ